MNGLDKITQRIADDARAQADAITAEAQAQADAVLAEFQKQADRESLAILERGRQDAAEQERRMESLAALEGRKRLLAAKQECLTAAFDKALEQLLSMPEEQYIDLLAKMCVKAAATGREAVVFSEKDKARVGKAVVAKANEMLAKEVSPKLPEELASSKAGAFLDKVVTGASALMAGTGMLTVAQETRPIRGGFILCSDGVEVNCAFDTLVRLSRAELERETARVLFEGN